MKFGLEVEYWVVDDEGRPCDGDDLLDAHERVEPEFIGPLVEIKTSPHGSVADLARELRETIRTVLTEARARGQHLVPLGTPLTELTPPTTTRRGALFEWIYGDGIVGSKNCAGTHVHFEQGTPSRQLDLLTALDPAIALVSSSPYYRGERSMDCSRAHAYRRECGEPFRELCDLWSYADDSASWDRRVQRRFERFVDVAVDRGVSRAEVEAHFEPDDAVLAPVRLRRSLPTVEWRAPDAALPSQLLRLVDDVASVLRQSEYKPVEVGEPGVLDDRIRIPPFSELRQLSDEAIRRGLDSDRVRAYLEAFGFDVDAYRPLSPRLAGPEELSESEARRIRLDCAERLRADVESLAFADHLTASPDPWYSYP